MISFANRTRMGIFARMAETWLPIHGWPLREKYQGCFSPTFKPGRGNYPEDGGYYTVNVYFYAPNDFGLYNMSGNVAGVDQHGFSKKTYAPSFMMKP